METLEETEQSIEEVVGREGGGELDGVENGRFQYPAWVDDTPRQHREVNTLPGTRITAPAWISPRLV